ncbi:HNH endonuclease [Corynebacterium ulcerans]|nr:HNH endonuclease [Corynebacterium ulcerans]
MAGWGGRSAARIRKQVLETYGDICHLCGRPGADSADHIIPRSRGGKDELDNLRPAHGRCNSSRGNKSMTQYRDRNPARRRATSPPSRSW